MPNTWPLVPLEELLTPVSRPETVDADKTYGILGAHWYAQGLYVKDITTGAGIQAKSLYRVEEGDFVYNRLFAWKGSFALATKENHACYVSNEFPCFAVNRSRLDGRFLWRFFSRSSIWDDALSESTGGTPTSRNRLKEHKFLAFRISLPPLDEQGRIVARIEQLAAKIQEARRMRELTTQEAEMILLSARSRAFNMDALTTYPVLADLCKDVTDGTHDTPTYVEEGIPFLTGLNIGPRGLDFDEARHISEDDHNHFSQHCHVEKGDVLLTLIGTIDKVAIVDTNRPFSIKNVGLLKPDPHQLDSRYLFHFLQSDGFRQQAISYAKQTAQAFVGLKRLRTARVPVTSLIEQRRIVAYLDDLQAKVDALKKLQTETAAQLDALLPSILDKAFRGEL